MARQKLIEKRKCDSLSTDLLISVPITRRREDTEGELAVLIKGFGTVTNVEASP